MDKINFRREVCNKDTRHDPTLQMKKDQPVVAQGQLEADPTLWRNSFPGLHRVAPRATESPEVGPSHNGEGPERLSFCHLANFSANRAPTFLKAYLVHQEHFLVTAQQHTVSSHQFEHTQYIRTCKRRKIHVSGATWCQVVRGM